jgi:accessory gene regulator protein AgrB
MLLLSKIRIYKHNFPSSKADLISLCKWWKRRKKNANWMAVMVHYFALIVRAKKSFLYLGTVLWFSTEKSAFLLF